MNQNHQHVIYVSYEDADEDWVVTFINNLNGYLRKHLGKSTVDDNFIWANYMLIGNENCSEISQQRLQQSKYLLTILSPAYLNTIKDREINLFNNVNNIFVVECYKTHRPEKLELFAGYQFWHEDKTGNVVRWADPEPLPDEREYYRLLDQMARDIVKVVKPEEEIVPSNIPASAPDTQKHQPCQVFINTTEEDRAVARGVQERLNGNIGSCVLPDIQVGLSPQEVQKALEDNLLNCDTTIVICDQAPLKWVYQQIQSIFKLNVKRKREKKSDMKIVVVNKPPPCNLEELLGLKFPNLKVLNCAEIADCMSNITEVILS